MAVYELDGKALQLGEGAWVADTAAVIGDLELGRNASVCFGAVVQGGATTWPMTCSSPKA